MAEFKLPELGENITEATVTKVFVSVGDKVEAEQSIIEIETEKAVVEVPVNIAGTVQEVRVKEGDVIKVGQVVLVLGEGAAGEKPKESAPEPEEKEEPADAPKREEPKPEKPAPEPEKPRESEEKPAESERPAGKVFLAAPSARRAARELGVDLERVKGSGPGGRISAADVKAHGEKGEEPAAAEKKSREPEREKAAPVEVEHDRYGEIHREPMSGVRKSTMQHIVTAWETIPHVTQADSADITELEKFRKQYGKHVENAGGKLTMTVLIMKVVAEGLKKFPRFNSFVDLDNEQLILKHYVNMGIAVDTPHGLMVPVIRNADRKPLVELAVETGELAERARARRVSIEELQGGTFTLTNLGGIGGLWFTPIIREPEVAILGVSRAGVAPVWIDDDFQARLMLPLSLSYDHRVIDGADAARFMRWIVETLEQPLRMALD